MNHHLSREQFLTNTPISFLIKPDIPFALQLHVTEQCNLRCKHCYNENWSRNLTFEDFITIIQQFQELVALANIQGTVYLTGGEPLLWPHIYQAIAYLRKRQLKPRILTNGTLITMDIARKLKKVGLSYIQVSLDGMEHHHDAIRGAGNFKKALTGIRRLRAVGLEVTIMVTVMKSNLDDVDSLITFADQNNINRISFGRFIPIGTGTQLQLQELSADETQSLFTKLQKPTKNVKVVTRDPLWAVAKQEVAIYGGCVAGQFLLDVLIDGTVLPCRRYPIPVGNIHTTQLYEIWLQSPLLRQLRKRTDIIDCKECIYLLSCGGGCRGLAHAINGNGLTKDPQCFAKNNYIVLPILNLIS